MIELVQKVMDEARARSEACSDLVAAIHSVWMDLGLELGKIMDKIREEERRIKT